MKNSSYGQLILTHIDALYIQVATLLYPVKMDRYSNIFWDAHRNRTITTGSRSTPYKGEINFIVFEKYVSEPVS